MSSAIEQRRCVSGVIEPDVADGVALSDYRVITAHEAIAVCA
ncbi:hypothetical protein JOE11_002100 [Robbsia andropogonis]